MLQSICELLARLYITIFVKKCKENTMFLDNTEFPYMIITYEGETFILVAKRNIRRLSFDMNFLAVGLVTNIEGSDKTLTYRLDKLMKETPSSVKETWFRRGYFAVNRSGIYIKFSKKHKNAIMKFFKSIPFFRTHEELS